MKIIYTKNFLGKLNNVSDEERHHIENVINRLSNLSNNDVLSDITFGINNARLNGINCYRIATTRYCRIVVRISGEVVKLYNIESLNDDSQYFQIDWFDVYSDVVDILVNFYKSDPVNASKNLYSKLNNSDFVKKNEWIVRHESDAMEAYGYTDPIHIFASFNDASLSVKSRTSRVNSFFQCFEAPLFESINFAGCPTPIVQTTLSPRNVYTQKEIWEVFLDVSTRHQSAYLNFEQVKEWYGLQVPMFTMFLFWIDSENFLSLDKNTTEFLKKNEVLKSRPETYTQYLALLKGKGTDIYREIVSVAIGLKPESPLKKGVEDRILEFIQKDNSSDSPNALNKTSSDVSIIAIKPTLGCDPKYLKTLQEETVYQLSDAYTISENVISYAPTPLSNLYSRNNVSINISGIVGGNGTGKSTLIELLYVALNNLAFISLGLNEKPENKFKLVEGVFVEIYIKSGGLYRLVISNDAVTVFPYYKENSEYVEGDECNAVDFNLQRLFYNIVINYSQHSLNSEYMGDWLNALFHKIDAYQTPIVIEPFRDKGNIDINRQDLLAKQRLLSNLLLPDTSSNSLRKLSQYYKAEKLRLSLNKSKFSYVYIKEEKKEKKEVKFEVFESSAANVLNTLYSYFSLDVESVVDFNKNINISNYAQLYILKKLVNIAITYPHYKDFFDIPSNKFIDLDEYCRLLNKDTSHITNKLRQALNFLKNMHSSFSGLVNEEVVLDIEELSQNIYINRPKFDFKIINHIPPAFLDIQIILEEDISFDSLSSGEKQKIYSIYSMLYHINNINSVSEEIIKYDYINIVFDEVELYFHPELQRTFINDMLDAIGKADTNEILGINIIFITHSPFILSDIPSPNTLFLEKKSDKSSRSIPVKNKTEAFGANIHELLMSGFFLKNSVGEFARKQIREIVRFHQKVSTAKEEDIEGLSQDYKSKQELFYFIQNQIGEEYLKGILENQIFEIEKILDHSKYKQTRIEQLLKQVELLKNSIKEEL